MRIERVTARAFGPFDGDSLELAPGLTVVGGPNESGKSSWHAAIRAGVCGIRRGRGAGTKAEAAFEERHRPWDGDGRWEVEVRLTLDDGRTIEINQDLGGKVACRATDVGLGRDVSSEIMDGTPDASRWLGLDRDAFGATICVNQAQIAAIAGRDTAAALQEHMQRAAATRGTDATAAEARSRLDDYRREKVGLDRQNARGPMRAARLRMETATAELDDARRRHEAYLAASARCEAAERVAATLEQRTTLAEAALARRTAEELAARVDRAAALAARHPTEPAGGASRDARADTVAAALDAWRSRPAIEPLRGTTAAELEIELAALPETPVGDLEVHPSVADARRALDRADEAMALHGARPPAPPSDDPGLAEDELRSIARRLRAPEPALGPSGADESAGTATPSLRRWMPAGLVAIAAIAAAAVGQPVAAALGALLAGGLAAWAWLAGRDARQAAEQHAALTRAAADSVAAARDAARAERLAGSEAARAAGLPADPDELERLADARHAAERAARELAAWDAKRDELVARRAAAADALAAALTSRATMGEEPSPDYASYEEACRRRAQQAARAAARSALVRALDARRSAEASAAESERLMTRAADALRSAARAAGLPTDGAPEELVRALEAWKLERAQAADRDDLARREWQELTTLLAGRRLEEMVAEASRAEARAVSLASRLAEERVDELAGRDDLDQLIEVERDELERAREEASTQRGALEQMRLDLPDVAEAEEALAEATAELERVTGLGEVIDATVRLLRAAEERVHRDLAPVLASGITRWLPRVSGGAYVDASVDPADLSVRVKEAATGRWRSALLLSEGTREQIYLLLRVAMAQQLATTGETAPLLLDEVTAQADAERKLQLLEALHELSAERQIVLFTHDDDVMAWAARALAGERDRLVQLPARTAVPQAALA